MKQFPIALVALIACGLYAYLASNPMPSVVATKPESMQTETERAVIEQERKTWELHRNKKFDVWAELHTADYRAVYDDAISNKEEEMANLRHGDIKEYSLFDIKAASPNKDTVILTYKANFKGTYKGKNNSGVFHCAAVWVNQDGQWRSALYTEAKAKK